MPINELFIDELSKIHFTGEMLRFDFVRYAPLQEGQPPIIQNEFRLIMPPNGFIDAFKSMQELMDRLVSLGILQRQKSHRVHPPLRLVKDEVIDGKKVESIDSFLPIDKALNTQKPLQKLKNLNLHQQMLPINLMQTANEVAETTAKEVAQTTAKEVAQTTAKEVAETTAKEVAETTAKEVAETTAKEVIAKEIVDTGKNLDETLDHTASDYPETTEKKSKKKIFSWFKK
jgi:hypothetical protein